MNCPSCGQGNSAGARFCNQCGAQLAGPAEPTVDHAVNQANVWIHSAGFVGRQRELDELQAALDDAVAGRARLVMMAGEPGIGKTRTAQELATSAAALGFQVLWGRCHSTEGTPPYWPWVQVVREHIRGSEPEGWRSEMGPGAADITEIVPDVRERLPDLKPSPVLEPQQARFRLFDSIAAFLKRASQSQPLVLVLDNLHWADRSSLLLLEFLAQELSDCRLMVLGTYRDNELTRRHPLSQTLGELARESSFRRVVLRGLNEPEVAKFILANCAVTPSEGLVEAVHLQTEGNPLFLTHVVQLLVQEGELTPESVGEQHTSSITIPVGVREVIGRRLERLSDDCNQVLLVASVIGREFELELLEQLVVAPGANPLSNSVDQWGGVWSGDKLLAAVEEALVAKVIDEIPHTVSRYQFAHVLIQETLAQELSAARRARLHRHIGEALEDLYGKDAKSHASELAYHFALAASATNTDQLVRYSTLAGEQALAAFAHEEAVNHFERALAAREGKPMDSETAALFFGLAKAQIPSTDRFRMETYQEPLANVNRAFNYYAEVGDIEQAVAVAEYPLRMAALGVGTGEEELISRALSLVPVDSHYAGRLLATYGLILYQETGDYEGAQESFGQALAIARREQDLNLELRTITNSADVDFFHLCWPELLKKGERAIELMGTVDDLLSEAVIRYLNARTLDYTGDSREAQRQANTMLVQAESLRSRGFLMSALYISGVLAMHQGDWPAARGLFDRGMTMIPQNPPLLCARTLLEYQPGNFDLGQANVDQLLEATGNSGMGAGFA